VLFGRGWGLEECNILEAGCLSDLPVNAGNIDHVGISDVNDEIADLAQEVVLFTCQQCSTLGFYS
jgi:hypothetical protein